MTTDELIMQLLGDEMGARHSAEIKVQAATRLKEQQELLSQMTDWQPPPPPPQEGEE